MAWGTSPSLHHAQFVRHFRKNVLIEWLIKRSTCDKNTKYSVTFSTQSPNNHKFLILPPPFSALVRSRDCSFRSKIRGMCIFGIKAPKQSKTNGRASNRNDWEKVDMLKVRVQKKGSVTFRVGNQWSPKTLHRKSLLSYSAAGLRASLWPFVVTPSEEWCPIWLSTQIVIEPNAAIHPVRGEIA